MAKIKTDAVEVHPHPSPPPAGAQAVPEGEGTPEPEPKQPELVTVVAVERLFVAAEARYVEPGETVMLPEPTAMVLLKVGAAGLVTALGDRKQHEEAG